jgi:aspartyl-tRNA(Asn)/glutamyl-tRNA(Gln) amidotransferase subunit C
MGKRRLSPRFLCAATPAQVADIIRQGSIRIKGKTPLAARAFPLRKPREMSLSDDQIRRLARLARIALEGDEVAEVAGRLNRILGLVEEMQAVDTAGIEPMAHALELVQRLRPDEVTEPDRREPYQSVAPAVEGGLYLVPRVIE